MQKSVALVLSLVAVSIAVVAQPARAQETPYRQQPVQQDTSPQPSKWWEGLRKGANAGEAQSRGLPGVSFMAVWAGSI